LEKGTKKLVPDGAPPSRLEVEASSGKVFFASFFFRKKKMLS
jgi:hypothetical protein